MLLCLINLPGLVVSWWNLWGSICTVSCHLQIKTVKRERIQINKIKISTGEITTDTKETQRIVRKCYGEPCAKKLDNQDDMDKFLETYNPPKLNQEESENLNRLITTTEIDAAIKNLPTNTSPGLPQVNFTQHLKN